MKLKITGIISFVCAIGWLIALIVTFVKQQGVFVLDLETKISIATMLIFILSTILYIVWTSFGNRTKTEIEKIDFENKILRMKIEQKELKIKLES